MRLIIIFIITIQINQKNYILAFYPSFLRTA